MGCLLERGSGLWWERSASFYVNREVEITCVRASRI
jgi:hypothetical protein